MDDTQATLAEPVLEENAIETTAPAAEKPELSIEDSMAKTYADIKKKSAKLQEAPEDPKPAPAAKEEEPAADAPKTEDKPADKPVDAPQALQPPSSLKGSVKEKFASLPLDVQQEFLKREDDFHKGMQAQKPAVEFAKAIVPVVQPFIKNLESAGYKLDTAIKGMMETDHYLRNGSPDQKIQVLRNLIQQNNIDPNMLFAEQAPVDPNVQYLHQRLAQQEQQMATLAQQRQQQEAAIQAQQQQEILAQIERSKQGKEHFDDVRPHMVALLNAGQAKDLDEAYDQAVWARPDLRQKLIAKQQEAIKAEAVKNAQAAKQAAAANVSTRGTLPAAKPKLSMEQDMAEIYRGIKSR